MFEGWTPELQILYAQSDYLIDTLWSVEELRILITKYRTALQFPAFVSHNQLAYISLFYECFS